MSENNDDRPLNIFILRLFVLWKKEKLLTLLLKMLILLFSTSNITSASAGILAGLVTDNVTVSNCCTTGRVNLFSTNSSAVFNDAGGLVGYSGNSNIFNCFSNVTVNAVASSESFSSANAGGLVGGSIYGTVSNCYSTGSVNSQGYFAHSGGISGSILDVKISNCYSVSTITANGISQSAAGGISGSYGKTVTNCAALNPKIESVCDTESRYFGRICSTKTEGLSGNIAFDEMINKDK